MGSSATGDWTIWASVFTDDATYIEHAFGEFHGRREIEQWIVEVMKPYPQMRFPVSWHVIDEARGWVVFQCQNRLAHPTEPDGPPFQFPTWSKIHYAGDHLWSYEEDNYNPAEAGKVIEAWRAAGGRLRTRQMKMRDPA